MSPRIMALGTEWAFYGTKAKLVMPKRPDAADPEASRDKSADAYFLVEDALMNYARANKGNPAYARRPRGILVRLFREGLRVTREEWEIANVVMMDAVRIENERAKAFEAA